MFKDSQHDVFLSYNASDVEAVAAAEKLAVVMDKHVRDGLQRIIPVLLPGVREPGLELPGFLRQRMWVDFADSLDDPAVYHRLLCGIRGVAPIPLDLEGPPASE